VAIVLNRLTAYNLQLPDKDDSPRLITVCFEAGLALL
jgi:hypothetical protein